MKKATATKQEPTKDKALFAPWSKAEEAAVTVQRLREVVVLVDVAASLLGGEGWSGDHAGRQCMAMEEDARALVDRAQRLANSLAKRPAVRKHLAA